MQNTTPSCEDEESACEMPFMSDLSLKKLHFIHICLWSMVLGYLIVLCIAMYCIVLIIGFVWVFFSSSLLIIDFQAASMTTIHMWSLFFFFFIFSFVNSVSSNDKTQSKTKAAPSVAHSQVGHTTSARHTFNDSNEFSLWYSSYATHFVLFQNLQLV